MKNMSRLLVLEAIYFLIIFHCNYVTGLKKCNPEDALLASEPCPTNSGCNVDTKTCECSKGHILKHNTCVVDENHKSTSHTSPNTSSLVDTESSNSHVVAAILVPLFLISVVLVGLYFCKKYRIFSWMRSKFFQRSTNYDEFMIGQDVDDDDPPLR